LDLTLFVILSLSPVIVNAIAAQTGSLQGTINASGANGQTYNVPGATLKLIPSVPALIEDRSLLQSQNKLPWRHILRQAAILRNFAKKISPKKFLAECRFEHPPFD